MSLHFYAQSLVTTNRPYCAWMKNRRITQYIDGTTHAIMQQKVYCTLFLRLEFEHNGQFWKVSNLPVNWFTTVPHYMDATLITKKYVEAYEDDIITATEVTVNGFPILVTAADRKIVETFARQLMTRLMLNEESDIHRFKENAEKAAVKRNKRCIKNMENVNKISVDSGSKPLFTKLLDLTYTQVENLAKLGIV